MTRFKPGVRVQYSNGVKEIMSPKHPDWKGYCRLLGNRLKVQPCSGKLKQAQNILMQLYGRFPEINIEKTMDYFKENGGYCDCEVLMNVR